MMEKLEDQIVNIKFECKDKAKGGCEGKMRMGIFRGFYCTKHMNKRADELGVYPQTDADPMAPQEGRDQDWNRRHPKPRTRRKA